jgi:hypothetical protein
MFDKRFWIAAGERAAKTAAQAAVLAILGSGMMSEEAVNAFSVNWLAVIGFAIGGAILSVLTSLISAPLGKNPGPSLADESVEPGATVLEPAAVRGAKTPKA